MSEEMPCCAHMRVVNRNNDNGSGTITREWWECSDCKTEFLPSRAVAYEIEKLRADLATERANALCPTHRERLSASSTCSVCEWMERVHSTAIKGLNEQIATERAARESLERERSEAKPIGWLHKVIVDKRVTGGVREGQIEVGGVWGNPSDHLYFTPERCEGQYFWWEAPVYLHPAHDARLTEPLERRVGELLQIIEKVRKIAASTDDEDFGLQQIESICRECLASTPREGTEEPKS